MSEIALRTVDDCQTLAEAPVWRVFGLNTSVRIDLPLEATVRERLELQVNALLRECGCNQSALTLLIVFAALLLGVWLARPDSSLAQHRWLYSGAAYLAASVAAGVVKLLVLWRSRRRLRTLLTRVEAEHAGGRVLTLAV